MKQPTVACASDFDRTTRLTPVPDRPGEFTVDLDDGWSSLVGVHGGYMCAIVVRGAEACAPGRSVRTLTTSFLRTTQVGPATLSVREVRAGRTMTTLVADLVQDGRHLITSRLTLLTDQTGIEWVAPVALDLPPLAECVERVVLDDDEWLTGSFEITTSGGGLAVEHGHIATCDGVLVAESFQTRLTTTG